MEAKRLMKVTYQDLKKGIRLNAYADAVIWSEDPSPTLAGLRFGGYAEVVRGLTDAIYGGATIEIEDVDGSFLTLKSLSKQYRREVSHEGLYAEATLIAEDEIQESSKSQDEKSRKHAQKDDLFDDNVPQQDIPAHICYIFCHPGNEDELFQAIDQKSYVPMIPEYQDYVLAELKRRRILRPLRVRSLYQELEAWKLCCEAKDQNLVRVMEDGLKRGKIKIPGASPGPSLLDGVHSVTDYLNTFGVTVAERIKKLFVPLFDPAAEPLSGEVLDINEYVRAHAGYPLYDAQLAVAEAIKRKLGQSKVALIVAGCGTGKTKIGSVAVAAAGLQSHQISAGHSKTFSIVLCPAHVTKKWVREIEESIPNTFAAVVRSISEFDLLYKLYEQGSRNCFAIISKEKARDGYMRAPAVIFRKWNREGLNIARPRANEEMPAVGFSPLRHVFCCPDCGAVIMENISKDGVAYWYMEQDDLTLSAKNAQFLKLFHAEDQGVVEDWISRCHAEEPYTAPRRDRKSALLYAVLERARACGDLREIEPILDYYLPTEQEPMASDLDSYLTNYQFSAVANISYGCEGIFVDLVIEGDFDDSGANRCVIGTFKTLRQDSDAGRLMGQLCGVLMYHTTRYVNENLHRYTPKRELEAELRRKQACGGQKEGKT